MKINGKSFVSGVVLGSVLFSSISFAAPSVVKLLVNGEEIHSEVSAQIIGGRTNGGIVEIEGKLAQPSADSGSMMGWDNASAKLMQEGKGIKTFQFSVPLYDNYEVKEIKLRYVEEKG